MDTDKLKALALAATPGPWEVQVDEHPHFYGSTHRERRIKTTWEHGQLRGPYPVITTSVGIGAAKDGPPRHMVAMSDEDAEFIAAANPATVLELIAERDELRAEVERLRAENGGLLSMAKTAETRMDASSEGGHLCAAPAAGTEKDATYDVLKSIIEDGYLSDTNTARGHAAIEAHSKAGKD